MKFHISRRILIPSAFVLWIGAAAIACGPWLSPSVTADPGPSLLAAPAERQPVELNSIATDPPRDVVAERVESK